MAYYVFDKDRTHELGLPEIVVLSCHSRIYTIMDEPPASQCVYCKTKYIQKHGIPKRSLLDILARKEPVEIIHLDYRQQRFLCQNNDCKKSFLKAVSFVEPKKTVTCRLEIYLFRQSLTQPVQEIERRLNGELTDTTIEKIFKEVTGRLDSAAPQVWRTPKSIGIHFVEIKKQKMLMVTNIDDEVVVDFLPNPSVKSIKKLSRRFQSSKMIQMIWIDINDTLFESVREVFPNAEIRIGVYQLERYLGRIITEIVASPQRSGKRPQLDTFLKNRDNLSKPTKENLDNYLAKNEDVRQIYEYKQKIPVSDLIAIESVIDSIADNLTMSSYPDYLLIADATRYKDILHQSFGLIMQNSDGHDLAKNHFPYKSDEIEQLLESVPKSSFEVLRARALYSDPELDIDQAFQDIGWMEAEEEPLSDLDVFCHSTIQHFCLMDYSNYHKPLAIGYPIKEVHERLQKYGTFNLRNSKRYLK